jgi:hypothetical protein
MGCGKYVSLVCTLDLALGPTVYETLGALNAFKRLGWLLTNRVRSSVLRS